MPYKDPEKQKQYERDWKRQREAKLREDVYERKAAGCVLCGEREPVCLEFHHTNPANKRFNIGQRISSGIDRGRLFVEANKCVVLCANCHKKLHAGVLSLEAPLRSLDQQAPLEA